MTGLDGLQGNVLTGYKTSHALYLFVAVADAARARRWLDARLERVTTHRGWEASPDATFNIAFTHAGLLSLGVPAPRLRHLEAFKAGMAARAQQLGDSGSSGSERWAPGLSSNDVLIVVTAHESGVLSRVGAEVRDSLAGGGLEIVHEQDAHALPGGSEHFGFQDGFSQPAVAGAATGPRIGEGTLTRWRRWRELALGEFVHGERDEGGFVPPAPLGPLGDESTFMVVRKLAQDVAAFRRYIRDEAARLARDPAWLAAKMVGRWQNGSSLVRYPDAPGPPAAQDSKASRFRYGQDRGGRACPLGSHVRRANPRDALGWEGRLTQRHRIIRRGMSYGAPLAGDSTIDDGRARGLVFVAYQAAIERQFEFIQGQWLADGNALRLGGDRDPIAASTESPAEMTVQGSPPIFLSGLPNFVTALGGGYYLLPGSAGLRALADGAC